MLKKNAPKLAPITAKAISEAGSPLAPSAPSAPSIKPIKPPIKAYAPIPPLFLLLINQG